MAYLGQGVIGTNASPHDRGTASIHFHHQSGRLGGSPGMWGYVKGGMGMVSFILCDIARDLGATVVTGLPVARIIPGAGSRARGGRADRGSQRDLQRRPPRDARSCWAAMPTRRGAERVEADSPGRLHGQAQRRAQGAAQLQGPPGDRSRTTTRARSTRRSPRTSGGRRSRPPGPESSHSRLWTELYFQTAHDSSVAPAGVHTMSVFAQYRAAHLRPAAPGTAAATMSRTWRSGRSAASARTLPTPSSTSRCSARPISSRTVGPDRRSHLPGRMPAALHVGQAAFTPHAHARRLPLRGVHPSRRQRDRHQRTQRRDGGAR